MCLCVDKENWGWGWGVVGAEGLCMVMKRIKQAKPIITLSVYKLQPNPFSVRESVFVCGESKEGVVLCMVMTRIKQANPL